MAEAIEFTLLSDEPNIEDDDPLGFEQVAEKLAATMLGSRRSTPFTLGIEGGWGSGKSSLMRQLDLALQADPAVTTVWFNAWSAEGASALEGMIKTALEQLDGNVLRRVLRNRKLIGLGRFIALVVTSRLGGRGLVDATWDRLSVDASARNELRSLVHEAIGRWRDERGALQGDRLLVMFIDDLDRASPEQVFEIFEAIKLYLDAPGFVFVIGYDNAVISEAVLEEKKYSRSVTGREYLEKIIQVGYRITSPDDDQSKALVDRFTGESGTTALFNEAARRLVIDRNQRNPRRIKRFLNAFVLLYALDPEWQQLGPEPLVEVLLLDTHFADFMALFRAGSELDPVAEFLVYRDDRQKILDDPDPSPVEDRLRDLQRTLPEQYPVLVENAEFVSLLVSLHTSPQWIDVCYKLQRRRRPLTTTVSPTPGEPLPPMTKGAPPTSVDMASTAVLLISDSPDHEKLELIRSSIEAEPVGSVNTTPTALDAQRLLATNRFDAVIVEVERSSGPDVGFDDLATLRQDDLYTGPVIFYTHRLTPERRERAAALGARIVADPAELPVLLARGAVATGTAAEVPPQS
jgi:CheY-like chemotaxis protein